jgi:hypothetical protein
MNHTDGEWAALVVFIALVRPTEAGPISPSWPPFSTRGTPDPLGREG